MFSELVDNTLVRTGRPNARAKQDAIQYVRNTMRECHLLEYFDSDRVETTITVTGLPFTWDKPVTFRHLETVQYPGAFYPKELPPGRRQDRSIVESEFRYFYAAGNYFVFNGVSVSDVIAMSYFSYAPYFKYYEVAGDVRPAVFDRETNVWSYLENGSYVANLAGGASAEEVARNLVSNWMLERWNGLIEEGTLTKLYGNKEDERSKISFSNFKSFQRNLRAAESIASLGK